MRSPEDTSTWHSPQNNYLILGIYSSFFFFFYHFCLSLFVHLRIRSPDHPNRQHESNDWSMGRHKGLVLLMETKILLKDHSRWGWLRPCCDDGTAQLRFILPSSPLLQVLLERKIPISFLCNHHHLRGHFPGKPTCNKVSYLSCPIHCHQRPAQIHNLVSIP